MHLAPPPRGAFFALVLLLGRLASPAACDAQDRPARADTTEVVELILADGSRLVGTIVSETERTLSFRTVGGITIEVDRSSILSRRVLRGRMVGREYRPRDPNVSRLLFSATGRPVGVGRGYFADYYLFFPFVAYGASDFLTLAGGVSLIPGVGGQILYVAPKATLVDGRRGAVSVGVLAGTGTGDIGDTWAGIFYGVSTVGDDDRSLTGGLGFLFGDGEVYDTPIFMIGGMVRTGRSTKLITENYVVSADGAHLLLSAGIRFFGERLAADLALLTSPEALDEEGFPFAPFVGFAYNFGR